MTGAAGMLGRAVAEADPRAHGVTRVDADLAEHIPGSWAHASGIVHCASWTDVDGAESRPDAARRDIVDATRNVAEFADAHGIPLVVVSTDYVFDGGKGAPYERGDAPAPLSTYGRLKLEAERAAPLARVVRTAGLYGEGGRHFPDAILRQAGKGVPFPVVADQVTSTTWTSLLAPVLLELLDQPPGIYHAVNEGVCSWWEFAREIVTIAGFDPAMIDRGRLTDLDRAAARPAYSALQPTHPLGSWRAAILAFLAPRPDAGRA